MWVQAVHDGSELAVRVSWSDPSRSPAPAWSDWREAVVRTMEPKEGDAVAAAATPEPTSAPADASGPQQTESHTQPATPATGPAPDMLVLQFPRRVPTGMDRPYFLMGSAREPVYLWQWQSEPEGGREMLGRGMGTMEPLPGSAASLTSQAVHDQGQWRVVFRRSIAVTDTANAISFPTRQAVPMAVFAWDGDNGEEGTRGAVSTWYFIYLDEPTSGTVYATPVLAMLLTAGLGVFAVGRAQRRERTVDASREAGRTGATLST